MDGTGKNVKVKRQAGELEKGRTSSYWHWPVFTTRNAATPQIEKVAVHEAAIPWHQL